MALTKKLRTPVFIITASFYVFLLLIPSFVQKNIADFQVYQNFFFNRNMNILFCLTPAALGFFFGKNDIRNKNTILAIIDTLILFLIFVEYFVSANHYLLLLTAIFILLFILMNTNELFAVAGTIPFFFLSDLDVFHYVLTVAIPLILLLAVKLNHSKKKPGKTAMRITMFIQCYICVFFAALLITENYSPYISSSLPQVITTRYIVRTAAAVVLLLLAAIYLIINTFRHSQKVSDKLIFTLAATVLFITGTAGYFSDILSTPNMTSVLISLIYIVIFNTHLSINIQTEQKNIYKINNIIMSVSAVLLCLSMLN